MADQFSIGGIPLDPKRITKPGLRDMYKAIRAAEPAEGKEAALAAIEELGKTGELPSESYEAVDAYRKEVVKEYRADKDRMWESWKAGGRDWKNPDVIKAREEMGVSGAFLFSEGKVTTALREATALAAVQAAAGGSFGPAGLVAGYAAYANDKAWDKKAQAKTEELLATYKEFQSGESRMITNNNSVQAVHRENLWPALTGMIKDATSATQAGKHHPITYQSYEVTSPEVVGELGKAAQAGVPVRMNTDIGRLSYPAKDEVTKKNYFEVDDIPHKARTGLQMMSTGGDVGFSFFPANRELGDPENLMHRKVLRSGDKVGVLGMNANNGSGENLDAGYIMEGEGALRAAENLRRDIQTSAGAGIEDIWGAAHYEKFKTEDLRVGRRGVTAILDSLAGPSPAGTDLPKTSSLADLEKLAKEAKVDLKKMFEIPEGDYERVVGDIAGGKGQVSLSAYGKEKLLEVTNRAIDMTRSEANMKALADIDLPSGKAAGKTRVDIADKPSEREVLVLNAIDQAEEFIYLPGFVVTRAVAAAIVAKKEQAEAAGKKLDIKVVADSGIYPDGGSPNSWGVNFLEDAGIDTKWSKLTRTGWHDRKIHAKQLLTDKGEIAGSTNFTKKGLQENWESSVYVHFEADDSASIAQRESSKAQFLELWNDDAYGLSAKDVAAYNNRFAPSVGKEYIIEEDRGRGTKSILQGLEAYEVETGKLVEGFLQDADYKKKYDAMLAKGYSEGDSAILAAEQHFGKAEFRQMRDQLPSNLELLKDEKRIESWKAKYAGRE